MVVEFAVMAVAMFVFGAVVGAGIVQWVGTGGNNPYVEHMDTRLTAFGARPATESDYELYRRAMEGTK